jgi:hypothetical protein
MASLPADVSAHEIMPGLLVGNMACAVSERTLKQLGITAVVSAVSKYRKPFPQTSTPHCGPAGLRPRHPLEKLYTSKNRIAIYVDDNPWENILRHFESACDFINYHLHRASTPGTLINHAAVVGAVSYDERRHDGSGSRGHAVKESGRVLVHCTHGVSRSVSIVAAYLMWKYGFCTSRALHYIRQRRSTAYPNEGFIDQLLVWEKLGCNPWLSRRFHIRPQAYHDMTIRLENNKHIHKVRQQLREARNENASRNTGSHGERATTRVSGTQGDTSRQGRRRKH